MIGRLWAAAYLAAWLAQPASSARVSQLSFQRRVASRGEPGLARSAFREEKLRDSWAHRSCRAESADGAATVGLDVTHYADNFIETNVTYASARAKPQRVATIFYDSQVTSLFDEECADGDEALKIVTRLTYATLSLAVIARMVDPDTCRAEFITGESVRILASLDPSGEKHVRFEVLSEEEDDGHVVVMISFPMGAARTAAFGDPDYWNCSDLATSQEVLVDAWKQLMLIRPPVEQHRLLESVYGFLHGKSATELRTRVNSLGAASPGQACVEALILLMLVPTEFLGAAGLIDQVGLAHHLARGVVARAALLQTAVGGTFDQEGLAHHRARGVVESAALLQTAEAQRREGERRHPRAIRQSTEAALGR